MKFDSQKLIENLIKSTNSHTLRVRNFLDLNDEILNKRIENKWTILECCEHLNQYFEFYLSELINKIQRSNSNSKENFKSGLIGNYFAESMLPKENLRKMKSPKDKNPLGKSLSKHSIENLIKNLNSLCEILEQSKSKDLEKIKIEISISKLVKLKLGDALRFITHHNERHILQAEKYFL